jgi:hypothetical protein
LFGVWWGFKTWQAREFDSTHTAKQTKLKLSVKRSWVKPRVRAAFQADMFPARKQQPKGKTLRLTL